MSGQDADEGRIWEAGWEGHTLEQQRRLASLPLWEKLEWLESADRLVRHLAQERQRSPMQAEDDSAGRSG